VVPIMGHKTPGVQRKGDTGYVSAIETFRAIESRVRPDFRKTIVFGLVALAALVAGHDVGGVHAESIRVRLISYGCALVAATCGVATSRIAANEVQRVAVARAGAAAGTPLRLATLLVGYLIVGISVSDLAGFDLKQLAVGGAFTGVVIGLAAQPVLSNLFAGVVLLFARPYVPGQRVRVMSGALNGPHTGVVVSAGLLYTMLETADGSLNIPNSGLLAAAVGPAPEDADLDDEIVDVAPAPSQVSPADADGAVLAMVAARTESAEQRQQQDQ
jgi:small-conductance mechanosensitive channel